MTYFEENKAARKFYLKLWLVIFGIVLFLTATGMIGCPQWFVWQQELSGRAKLKEAEWSRQIAVQEALAKKEAAKSLADAEVERAKGVAEANQIIGSSLKGNESYLRYLWVQGLQDGSSEVIYVPTEANLPIMEASRTIKKSIQSMQTTIEKENNKK